MADFVESGTAANGEQEKKENRIKNHHQRNEYEYCECHDMHYATLQVNLTA